MLRQNSFLLVISAKAEIQAENVPLRNPIDPNMEGMDDQLRLLKAPLSRNDERRLRWEGPTINRYS